MGWGLLVTFQTKFLLFRNISELFLSVHKTPSLIFHRSYMLAPSYYYHQAVINYNILFRPNTLSMQFMFPHFCFEMSAGSALNFAVCDQEMAKCSSFHAIRWWLNSRPSCSRGRQCQDRYRSLPTHWMEFCKFFSIAAQKSCAIAHTKSIRMQMYKTPLHIEAKIYHCYRKTCNITKSWISLIQFNRFLRDIF